MFNWNEPLWLPHHPLIWTIGLSMSLGLIWAIGLPMSSCTCWNKPLSDGQNPKLNQELIECDYSNWEWEASCKFLSSLLVNCSLETPIGWSALIELSEVVPICRSELYNWLSLSRIQYLLSHFLTLSIFHLWSHPVWPCRRRCSTIFVPLLAIWPAITVPRHCDIFTCFTLFDRYGSGKWSCHPCFTHCTGSSKCSCSARSRADSQSSRSLFIQSTIRLLGSFFWRFANPWVWSSWCFCFSTGCSFRPPIGGP